MAVPPSCEAMMIIVETLIWGTRFAIGEEEGSACLSRRPRVQPSCGVLGNLAQAYKRDIYPRYRKENAVRERGSVRNPKKKLGPWAQDCPLGGRSLPMPMPLPLPTPWLCGFHECHKAETVGVG
jgi:hypothetical protein